MELLKSLAIKNNFHYHKDRTQKVETIKLSNSEQVRNRQTKPNNFNGDQTKKPAKNGNWQNSLIFPQTSNFKNNYFVHSQEWFVSRPNWKPHNFWQNKIYSICWISMLFQKWLANLMDFFSPPSVYVKHVCFVNFTK